MPRVALKGKKRKLSSVAKGVKVRGKGYNKQMELDDEPDMIDPEVDFIDDEDQTAPVQSKYAVQEQANSDSEEELDSDEELQEALLTGQLKPGLHSEVAVKARMDINNENALKSKLSEMKQNISWVERLDVVSSANDLPPNVPNPLKDGENDELTTNDLDIVRNDIKRELLFTQQARATVFKALPRLHKSKIATQKPADYFAQMLKNESHMNRVSKLKEQKIAVVEKKEKAKILREQKKLGKKIQVEVLQQRQKEKREFNEKVKKLRKGKINSDFLDEKPMSKKRKFAGDGGNEKPKHLSKKEYKNSKYGNGGIKRDAKRNTADSSASFSDFRASKHSVGGKNFKRSGSHAKRQSTRARKGN